MSRRKSPEPRPFAGKRGSSPCPQRSFRSGASADRSGRKTGFLAPGDERRCRPGRRLAAYTRLRQARRRPRPRTHRPFSSPGPPRRSELAGHGQPAREHSARRPTRAGASSTKIRGPGPICNGIWSPKIGIAKAANITVRAVVADMSEEDALVAQGQENNERKNTSFVERCLYARRLNERGMAIIRIAAALAAPVSTVSKSVKVAERIPEELIVAIGPAPGVGRRNGSRSFHMFRETGRSATNSSSNPTFRLCHPTNASRPSSPRSRHLRRATRTFPAPQGFPTPPAST